MQHAPDTMGAAARAAAMHASKLDARLLVASSAFATPQERVENLASALRQWPALCRAMAILQEAAPNTTRQAQIADNHLQDFIEERT